MISIKCNNKIKSSNWGGLNTNDIIRITISEFDGYISGIARVISVDSNHAIVDFDNISMWLDDDIID